MRITVLGKSPAWQDAGWGVQRLPGRGGRDDAPARLRQRRVRQVARAGRLHGGRRGRDLPRPRRPLHRPGPLRVRACCSPRASSRSRSPATRDRRPGASAADRAARRRATPSAPVVGAWGDEELIEKAFTLEEYDASSTVEIGPLTATFAEVPHFILTHAVDLRLERRRPVHLRRRLPAVRRAGRGGPRHRPAVRRGDPAAPRAHRHPRPPDPGRGGRARPPRGRQAGRAHAHLRRARRRVGARRRPAGVRRPGLSVARARATSTSSELRDAKTSSPMAPSARHLSQLRRACGARWTSCSATRSRSSGRGSAARSPGSRPASTSTTAATSRRAVVKAELAGVDIDTVSLEVAGRELVISGERPVPETEGRVYQQVEIEAGAVPARGRARRRRRRGARPRHL